MLLPSDVMPNLTAVGQVQRLQIGQAMPFAREQASAIQKYQIDEAEVTRLGFVGDEQADQFFHGGYLQAIHQMPQSVYDLLKTHFPNLSIYEGMLGENIIIDKMNEKNVCIGDIYQLGSVQMQVTRPRRPCWKIDALLNTSGIAKFLQDNRTVGWYYQIIQTGHIKKGDACYLISRPYPFAWIDRLWQMCNDKTFKDAEEIKKWLNIEPLEQSFKDMLQKRIAHISQNN